MSAFFLLGALLAVGAVFHILRPLLWAPRRAGVSRDSANLALYREQERELEADLRAGTIAAGQYDQARAEIESRLIEDIGEKASSSAAGAPFARSPTAVVAVAMAIPLCALGIYLVIGAPQALFAAPVPPVSAGPSSGAPHEVSQDQIGAMVARLAAKLQENPANPDGWAMLGRSYHMLGRYRDASSAFANATKLLPDNAQLLADYADSLAMAQGRALKGEPEKLVARALKADPNNIKALALAGTVAFDRKDYAGATRHWERIVQAVPAQSEAAQSALASIEEARALQGKQPPRSAPVVAQAASGAPRVSGVARIAPQLAGKVAPTDTVFIYARAAEGPRMPLAILRKQARELPVSFVLDDSMAMSPQMKLSSVPRVVVFARISKTSEATPRSGDLQGQSQVVAVGAEGLDVLINSEVP